MGSDLYLNPPRPTKDETIATLVADKRGLEARCRQLAAERDDLAGWLTALLGLVRPGQVPPNSPLFRGMRDWYNERIAEAEQRTARLYREAVERLTPEQLNAIHAVGVDGLKGCEPGE